MIISIAATQFVFLSLGILALNVLLAAGGYAPNVASKFPDLAVQLGRHGLWMFAIPIAWVALASLCERYGLPAVARVTGVLIAAGIFGVFTYAGSLFF
jgi:hypothetical protein